MTELTTRSWRVEADFVPSTIEDVLELQQRLVDEAGASQAKANGAVMWVLLKAQGTDTTTSPNQRADYRKLFKKLAAVDAQKPRRRRRSAGAKAREGAKTPAELIAELFTDTGDLIVPLRADEWASPIISGTAVTSSDDLATVQS